MSKTNTKRLMMDNAEALRALADSWPLVKPLVRESTASALTINQFVAEHPSASVHRIAEAVDLHHDTVHIYLAALENAGMVKRSSSGEPSGVPSTMGGRPLTQVDQTGAA